MVEEASKRLNDVVEEIMSIDARTRNDDKWLTVLVLQRMGFKVSVSYNEIPDMPAFESISRCRRKIQETGKLKPTIDENTNRDYGKGITKMTQWMGEGEEDDGKQEAGIEDGDFGRREGECEETEGTG